MQILIASRSMFSPVGGTTAPAVTSNPTLTGTPQVGQAYSQGNGTASGSPSPTPTMTLEVSADGSTGWSTQAATGTWQAGDAGKYFRTRVSWSNGVGSPAVGHSDVVGPVEAAASGGLLAADDFEYLGFYNVSLNGMDQVYSQGLAIRWVSGEIRFIEKPFPGNPNKDDGQFFWEFGIAGKSYGDTVNTTTNTWTAYTLPDMTGCNERVFYDGSRLWLTRAIDYPNEDTPNATNITTMTLGAGSVGSLKRLSLENVPDRRCWSGVMAIPSSVQSALGIGPYAVGFGGYCSRADFAGGAALGLSAFAMPDPGGYSNNDEIPAGSVKALGTRGTVPRGKRHWYGASFNPTETVDLSAYGYSATTPSGTYTGKGPVNFYDGGDPRSNPSTPPTFQPVAAGQHLSPDGSGDAVWPQQNGVYSGGFWLDGTKKGLVVVGGFPSGRCWYQSSAGHSDGECVEIHVFDPVEVAEIVAGTRDEDDIEPSVMIPVPEMDYTEDTNYSLVHAAYDEVESKLYILQHSFETPSTSKLHVIQVATS